MEVYQVGGAVRDSLLGLPVKDRDWVVVGGDEAALLREGYRKVGADFPVFLHPETGEEYALARTERKSGRGYRGFSTAAGHGVSLEQDLARRDFTINAMARTADGEIIDPFAGRSDLAAGVLRHVTPAFAEDPLRILRAARFAARFGFEVADETQALMRSIVASGELETLAAERVWQELRRALNEPQPRRFITVLRECGALAVLFPEIDRLFGVPQPERYHPEIDTGEHLLLVLDVAQSMGTSEMVRFAALVHDLGKGTTPAELLPAHRGHEERGVELIKAMCERLRVPRNHRELACLVARLHTRVHRASVMSPDELVRLLEEADAWRRPERFDDFLTACTVDARGRTGLAATPYEQAERLRQARAISHRVNAASEVARGVRGSALAGVVHKKRVRALVEAGI